MVLVPSRLFRSPIVLARLLGRVDELMLVDDLRIPRDLVIGVG